MSEIEAIYTVWLREMIRYFRQKERIIGSLVMPVLWLLIFGGSMRSSIKLQSGLDYATFIAPGVIAMSLMFNSVSSGVSIIWDRELGFMKEMLIAPVSRISLVFGKALGTATTSLIQGTMVLLIAILIGLKINLLTFLIVLPLMILISLGLVGIGISIASLMNNVEGFQLIFNFLVMPMWFLSGGMFQINNLPGFLKILPYIDPLTYGVELLRYIITKTSSIPLTVSFSFVAVFSTMMMFISAWLFNRKS